ncbi:MAG: hypothetical protein A2049_08055 [Elusimicrobia bacterium GWA2_62_23]|nr:MAG: hypothetical protein A2049_08055 [Elusimicrobia bacterium GWA2_62_23]
MLKLKHPPLICFYVSNMFFSVMALVNNLLPLRGKMSFPGAMPFSFILPPRITRAPPLMGPVPNPDFPALCQHWMPAGRAGSKKIWLSFLTLFIYKGEFHI